ncbi:hypothetical protein OOJ96_21145 [Pseudomonas sp. 15FMM2]|uniref:Uncharacterized protein n=1 Tax=Pseudomonas imrae TaxID=2992837 RepID=A0ACC7PIN5_9PSED
MNSSLLILNSLALAVLVVFHFQGTGKMDMTQITQAGSYQSQQRPQLAVMTANDQSLKQLTQDARPARTSEHWVF